MISVREVGLILLAVLVDGLFNALFVLLSSESVITYKELLCFLIFAFVSTSVLMLARKTLSIIRHSILNKKDKRTHVMIVGGGGAGIQLIKEMNTLDNIQYIPVCVADDDPKKQGEYIGGVKVAGTTHQVEELVNKYSVEEIFITMPSISKKIVGEIVKRCKKTGCVVKTLPDVYQLANGKVTMKNLRQVDVKDLLGREQSDINDQEIAGYIENKVVLVTGGGGSIGSELCRQIASFKPRQLIILDCYENNAYEIQQELKRYYKELDLVTLIANVRESEKVKKVFGEYKPQIVFHAAAHKHVPLMEKSPNEAVKNNVFGTLNVAKRADEFGVETFVLISTDKAVNPTNIMGATKRICEMIIQAIGRHSKTNFVAVRFGNVLGSNGSVIPLFKKQIAEGGPVTVTHKDMVRYFMTIPEAVSLVLQAGAYAKSGQIFVLDMGEPVRIYELAVNLIKMSGYEPGVDIDIVCTGLRPGEKLYEERLMDEEGLQKTANGQISIAKPIDFDEQTFWTTLDKLYAEAYGECNGMKYSVKELVDTYTIDER
ncbi:MAG: polysaccharide biosynthesis protein [Clostridia bacterium]|nr:polysaccharide biosynthesis protein [Clostridia bacterium]